MTRGDRQGPRRSIIALLAVTTLAAGAIAIGTHRVHWNVEDVRPCARGPAILVVDGIAFSVGREAIRQMRPYRPQSCSPIEVDGFAIGPSIIRGQEDLTTVSRTVSFPTAAAMARNHGMRPPRPMSFTRYENRKGPDAVSGIIDMHPYSGTYRCWRYDPSSMCRVVLYKRSRTGAVSIGRTWTTDPAAEDPASGPVRRTVRLADEMILRR